MPDNYFRLFREKKSHREVILKLPLPKVTQHRANSRRPIPLLLTNCLDRKAAEELTVEKLIAVVEKAIAPNSFLLLPVEISSGTSKCSVLPVHCPPARTMDCTRSFMAGMQMRANESASSMDWFLFLVCSINDLGLSMN